MTAASDTLLRARSEADLAAGYRRLARMLALVLSEPVLDDVVRRIAEALSELVPADDLVLWQLAGDELSPLLTRGRNAESMRSLRLPLGVGIIGLCALTGKPIRSNDAHLDPRRHRLPGIDAAPRALICVPLRARETLLGALSLYRYGSVRGFSLKEFELVAHFAEVAAIAIANARSRSLLEQLATTDELTGIANRRRFHEELARQSALAERHRHPLALLLFDLDDFKAVNDTFGHHAGDEVLRAVASILGARARQGDLPARLGGDEFALLLPHTGTDEARLLAEDLQTAIAATGHGIGASVGVVSLEDCRSSELLLEADRFLYRAKQHRRADAVRGHGRGQLAGLKLGDELAAGRFEAAGELRP
jgi:diguanylate cyclase (GGDEF)-like protein